MFTATDKKFLEDAFAAHKKWAEGTFETKKESGALRDSFDLLRNRIVTSHVEKFDIVSEMQAIRASNIRMEDKFDALMTTLDGYAGKVADIDQENKFGAVILHRHDVQIHELSLGTGVAVSD